MTQEDKELLLKDLCARLPYKLVCEVNYEESGKYKTSNMILSGVFTDEAYFTSKDGSIYSSDYKPYLFPLSSMSEEQRKEFDTTLKYLPAEEINFWTLNTYDWCNKNHFDYRGLIPKGLAIDATGKNIY